jgi:hypothetical protein
MDGWVDGWMDGAAIKLPLIRLSGNEPSPVLRVRGSIRALVAAARKIPRPTDCRRIVGAT